MAREEQYCLDILSEVSAMTAAAALGGVSPEDPLPSASRPARPKLEVHQVQAAKYTHRHPLISYGSILRWVGLYWSTPKVAASWESSPSGLGLRLVGRPAGHKT